MSKTQLQTNNTRLASLIQELQGKAAGGGGTSVETCTVTIKQQWGGNDDPMLCTFGFDYYSASDDGSVTPQFVKLTSEDDFEPEHSVTFTAFKNVPIIICVNSSYWQKEGGVWRQHQSITTTGGEITYGNWYYRYEYDEIEEGASIDYIRFIPTSDTATLTISGA